MIKLNGNRTIRETTAEFQFTDKDTGDLKFETITVRYYSPRISDWKQLKADITAKFEAEPDGAFFLSEGLARQIQSLPDLSDEKGKPLKITPAVLEEYIDVLNLQAIRDAIDADLVPKSQPAK